MSAQVFEEPHISDPCEESPRSPVISILPASYRAQPMWGERLLATGLLVIVAPVIGLLAILVRLTSRGPSIYRQARVGQFGKIFVMYKIRTMVADAEETTGPQWTRINDPRITLIGWVLRKMHLDELPQLINVVRGEMGLMGPRPERPELIHVLADHVPNYYDRLAVLPGITGLAQVNLPPDTDLESVRNKLFLDLEYVRTASFWLDVRMFIWTGMRLFGVPASWATRLTRLSRSVPKRSSDATASSKPLTIETIVAEAAEERRASVHATNRTRREPLRHHDITDYPTTVFQEGSANA